MHTGRQARRRTWKMLLPIWFNRQVKRDPLPTLRAAFHVDADGERAFTPEMIEAYAKHMRRNGVPAVNYYRACAYLPTFRLKRVKLPVRLIWGDSDPWMAGFLHERATYGGFVDQFDIVLVP